MSYQDNTPIVGNLQTISINRGTTLQLKARRRGSDGQPIIDKAQEIYFVVKKHWTDEKALIKKSLKDMTFDSDGYYHFTIYPEDTEGLRYGQYVWDFTPVENNNLYRSKPAHGYFVVGNSAGWIINEE